MKGLQDSIWGFGYLPGEARMRTHVCSECGDEFETDEAEKWRGTLCGTCARVDRIEQELVAEWEKEVYGDD